jgi:hypothetical protein
VVWAAFVFTTPESPAAPDAPVQFHPVSIMTLGGDVGLQLLANLTAGWPRLASGEILIYARTGF